LVLVVLDATSAIAGAKGVKWFSNSSISGTGITTITSAGGGGGGSRSACTS
jgi:hypothetical protein